jgi:hypothetical protein
MPTQSAFFRKGSAMWLPECFLTLLTAARDYIRQFPGDLSVLKSPTGGYDWHFTAAVLEAWEAAEDMAGHEEGADQEADDELD